MSMIKFTNNIKLSHVLIDDTKKSLSEMQEQINNPTRTLVIKSMFDYPGVGRMQYINPNLANYNISLYKQTGLNKKKWDYIGNFSSLEPIGGFIDSNISNRTPVRYLISSGQNTQYTSFQTSYLSPNWDRWSIQDIIYDTENHVYKTTGDIYLFRSNLESGDINANSNTIKYDSLGRYGRVYKGDLKYESSQLSCLFGDFDVCQDVYHSGYLISETAESLDDVDDILNTYPASNFKEYYLYIEGTEDFEYSKYYKSNGSYWDMIPGRYTYCEDREKLDKWRDFVYSNNLKLLKDCQGNKWIVSMTDSISRAIDNKSGQYPTKISFTWQEVMDAKTTPIINLIPYAAIPKG